MGMVHRGNRSRLAIEAITERGLTHLDGDQPVEACVACLPHLAHAAGAEGGEEFIRAEPHAGRKCHEKRGL